MNVVSARAGSSPHTRGARSRSGIGMRARRDHPRIRGEHCCDSVPLSFHLGSSPHTRGAPKKRKESGNAARIIPAYAGSTSVGRFRKARRQDHPRIRGEHPEHRDRVCVFEGSSPHTRGARDVGRRRRSRIRIIPAYAGSTATRRHPPPEAPDHPRIRGEHLRPAGSG